MPNANWPTLQNDEFLDLSSSQLCRFFDDLRIHFVFAQVATSFSGAVSFLSHRELRDCFATSDSAMRSVRAHQRFFAKALAGDFELQVHKSRTGRPVLSNDWDLSFSDKDRDLLVALCSAPRKIGVDLELRNSVLTETSLTNRLFSEEELPILNAFVNPNLSRSDSRILGFSAKESIAKAFDMPFLPLKFKLIECTRDPVDTNRFLMNFNVERLGRVKVQSITEGKWIISICEKSPGVFFG